MIAHNEVLKYTTDLLKYPRFYLQVAIVDTPLEFEYKHLLMGIIQRVNPKSRSKSHPPRTTHYRT